MIELGKAYLSDGVEIVVCGNPDDNDMQEHNCDEMGCRAEHVLFRAMLPTNVEKMAKGLLKLTDDLKYIRGIVERGTGVKIQPEQSTREYVLMYVQSLEKALGVEGLEGETCGEPGSGEHINIRTRRTKDQCFLCMEQVLSTEWREHMDLTHNAVNRTVNESGEVVRAARVSDSAQVFGIEPPIKQDESERLANAKLKKGE